MNQMIVFAKRLIVFVNKVYIMSELSAKKRKN